MLYYQCSRDHRLTSIDRGDTMANTISIKNGRLAIDAEVDDKGYESASGKTMVHFTTHGFVNVEGSPYRISITMTKAKAKGKAKG